jgi:hypothetical protein
VTIRKIIATLPPKWKRQFLATGCGRIEGGLGWRTHPWGYLARLPRPRGFPASHATRGGW